MMDAQMDAGMASAQLPPPIPPPNHLPLPHLIALLDEVVCGEVAWYSGLPLVQTLFRLDWMHTIAMVRSHEHLSRFCTARHTTHSRESGSGLGTTWHRHHLRSPHGIMFMALAYMCITLITACSHGVWSRLRPCLGILSSHPS